MSRLPHQTRANVSARGVATPARQAAGGETQLWVLQAADRVRAGDERLRQRQDGVQRSDALGNTGLVRAGLPEHVDLPDAL